MVGAGRHLCRKRHPRQFLTSIPPARIVGRRARLRDEIRRGVIGLKDGLLQQIPVRESGGEGADEAVAGSMRRYHLHDFRRHKQRRGACPLRNDAGPPPM